MFLFDEKILEDISKLSIEDLESYISSRVQTLEENSTENRESISSKNVSHSTLAHGFIPSTTEIYAESGMYSVAVGGFLLNDTEIYRILINNLKNCDYAQTLEGVLQSVQSSIDEYFGGLAFQENEENRRNLFFEMQKKYDDLEPYSISEYRNNNTALCSERSAIAQNMLAFLGADTYYMVGHLSRNDGMENLHHAYNCIVDREYGSGIIVDFTNPILRNSTHERFISQSNIINKNLIAEILAGNSSFEITRPEFFMQDGNEMRKMVHCNYSLKPLTQSELSVLQSKPTKIETTEISIDEIGKGIINELEQTEEIDQTFATLRKHQEKLKEQQEKQQED